MDPLEKFIRNNKDELKKAHPDRESLWAKIDNELSEEQPVKAPKVITISYKFLMKAAAIILLCGIMATVYFNNATQSPEFVMSDEFKEIDAHYAMLVNSRIKELRNNKDLTENEKEGFLKYIEDLEKEALDLQKELSKNLNNELIIEAMIDNYKERLRMMEQLLNRLENIKKNEEDENITI